MYYLNKYHSLIPCDPMVNNKLPQGGYGVCNPLVCKNYSFSSFATPNFCKAHVGGPTRFALRSETYQKQASSNWTFALTGLKQRFCPPTTFGTKVVGSFNKKFKMLCSASKHGKMIDGLASDSTKPIYAGNRLNVIRKIVHLKTKPLTNQDAPTTFGTKVVGENFFKLNPTKMLESTLKTSDYSRNGLTGDIPPTTFVPKVVGEYAKRGLQYVKHNQTTSDVMNKSGKSAVTEASTSKLKVFLNKSYNKHINQYFALGALATFGPKGLTQSVAPSMRSIIGFAKHVMLNNQSMDLQATSRTKVTIKKETKGFSSFFGLRQNNQSNKSWMLKNKQKTNMLRILDTKVSKADVSFAKVKNNLTKENLYKSFNNPNTRYSKMMEISLITISLASANRIRQWAEKTLPNGKVVGEVINPETVHYKTLKPIKGGLFCERIFGPLKDYECACGKKFNIKQYLAKDFTLSIMPRILGADAPRSKTLQKRYFCRVCDVEYTYSLIRRTQLGYIALATPTTHVWFVKGLPSYISILLDMKKTHLHNVIYNIRTLTLEHAFRGPRNMPTSPSLIYETWQKIMEAQYPDKYGPSKENLLTTDLKKQSGNITPLLLKTQKTQSAILKTAPTKKGHVSHTGDGDPQESNNKKHTVFTLRSNKLTSQEIKKTNLCYLATKSTSQTQYATPSKQKNLILLSPKKIKQIYKENKKKYSRSLNLYNLYVNNSFKKTSWIKVYSFFSVKSYNIFHPISQIPFSSAPGKEQDALLTDKTIFGTKVVGGKTGENPKLQNIPVEILPQYVKHGPQYAQRNILPWWTKLLNHKDKHSLSIVSNKQSVDLVTHKFSMIQSHYAKHTDVHSFAECFGETCPQYNVASSHNFCPKSCGTYETWQILGLCHAAQPAMFPGGIGNFWNALMLSHNFWDKSCGREDARIFDHCFTGGKTNKSLNAMFYIKTFGTKVAKHPWHNSKHNNPKAAKIQSISKNHNHLLISNLLNTSLYKFWEFFGKINQKTIYSVFGHDWFEFKGTIINTSKIRTQTHFIHQNKALKKNQVLTTLSQKQIESLIGLLTLNKAQFFTTDFLNMLLMYTSSHNFCSAKVVGCEAKQSRLVGFNNKKAISSTDVIMQSILGTNAPKLKQDNKSIIQPCDLLLTNFKNFEKHTTKLAILFLLNIKNKITTNTTKSNNQLRKTTMLHLLGAYAPKFTKLKHNSLFTSLVWFSNLEKYNAQDVLTSDWMMRMVVPNGLGAYAPSMRSKTTQNAKSKNHIKQIKEKTNKKIITKIKFFHKFTNIVKGKFVQRLFAYSQTFLGCDTRHFRSKVLSNKTQALQTFKTSKILTYYFFFLKPHFKNITSTIYNSLLKDTIKIQKNFYAPGCGLCNRHNPKQKNNVLTYFFVLKAFFHFMNNAKHSFDVNFRIKKIYTKSIMPRILGAYAPNITGSTYNLAKLGSSGVPSVSLGLKFNNKPLLVNNIYCLSHRELWEQEKDWQDFAYYYYPSNWLVANMLKSSKNKISIETPSSGRLVSLSRILPDLFIPFYKHRNYEILFKFDNSFTYTDRNYFTENFQNYSLGMNINTAFSGAGLIQKLLNDFDFSELKKLDKQNRILLFDYNKYIKKLKTKLVLEMKAYWGHSPPVGEAKLRKKSNDKLEKKIRRIYSKACQIRDALIRRTKLTRKIYNFMEDPSFSNKNVGRFGDHSSNPQLRTSTGTGSAMYTKVSSMRSIIRHNRTEKEQITNGLNMILTLLPVLPPVLRPVLKMSGQFTVSDLNRLYQRIIYRNERLKKFLQDPALNSSFEMKYAQRLVQEAVDNLIQNGKSGVVPEKDTRGRLLKSLSDILKGKQGRFRQYLLGKRVDYSGRSVIVVGPRLKLHECGIPKEMAVVLYSPFLIKRILNEKIADTYLAAKKIIKTNPLLVSQLLREIMKSCPVLLNRAPTLHRLGFQAFQPKLVDGKAILLHPLVCPAFNADFDGDQMAVHVPITFEARAEAWKLMLARNNLLSSATGEPLILPSQDMVLGCYYLTFLPTQNTSQLNTSKKCSSLFFHNINSVLKAYNQQLLHTHKIVWVNLQAEIETGNVLEQPLEIRLSLAQYKLPESALHPEYAEHNKKQLLINSTSSHNFCSAKVVGCEAKQTNKNQYYNLNYIEIYPRLHNFLTIKGTLRNQIIRTTPGKILFNMLIKKALEKKSYLTV